MIWCMADAKTWKKRVSAWRASGETAEAFAAELGCAPSTLKWWAWHLGKQDAKFVRVVTKDAPPKTPRDEAVELEVAGVRLRLRAGFDRRALAEVLDVLREGARS